MIRRDWKPPETTGDPELDCFVAAEAAGLAGIEAVTRASFTEVRLARAVGRRPGEISELLVELVHNAIDTYETIAAARAAAGMEPPPPLEDLRRWAGPETKEGHR